MSVVVWQRTLEERMPVPAGGAQFETFGTVTDEARCALEQPVMTPLASLVVLRVHGEDATSFLQAQLSADIAATTVGGDCLAAWCTPKGRVIALFHVLRRADDYLLLTAGDLLEKVLPRLRLYLLRARVRIEDLSDRVGVLGCKDIDPLAHLEHASREHDEDRALAPASAGSVVPGVARELVVASPRTLASLWDRLADKGVAAVGEAAWRHLLIRDGEPWVHAASSEHHLPQMLNLDRLGGISFSKGCYPGQEIVARTRYLGQLKRRLHVGHCESPTPPAIGSAVRVAGGTQAVGEVLLSAPGERENDCVFSAVMRLDALEGALRLGDDGDAVVGLSAPPYPFADD